MRNERGHLFLTLCQLLGKGSNQKRRCLGSTGRRRWRWRRGNKVLTMRIQRYRWKGDSRYCQWKRFWCTGVDKRRGQFRQWVVMRWRDCDRRCYVWHQRDDVSPSLGVWCCKRPTHGTQVWEMLGFGRWPCGQKCLLATKPSGASEHRPVHVDY